jgi:hypothetical protein
MNTEGTGEKVWTGLVLFKTGTQRYGIAGMEVKDPTQGR